MCALDVASECLKLFKANLLEEGSFDVVVDGCECVFHITSPCFVNSADPQIPLTICLLSSISKCIFVEIKKKEKEKKGLVKLFP